MVEIVHIRIDDEWKEISRKEIEEDYEFFVFGPVPFYVLKNGKYEKTERTGCYGNYNSLGKAKTKITVCTNKKNKDKFRVMARKEYNFYPLDIGVKYTDRKLWDE